MKIISAIIFFLLLLVMADYQGFLGIHHDSELDYFSVQFAAKDDQTGGSISDFFINCTRKGSRNACSIDQKRHSITREAKFGIVKLIKNTWLFHKSESVVGEGDVDVQMMFIHPDYDRLNRTYTIKQLLLMQNKTVTVKLKRSSE